MGQGRRTVTLRNLMVIERPYGKADTYVRRKGLPLVKLPDLPHDDPAFLAAYAAAMAVATPEKPQEGAGTFGAVITAALASPRYRRLSDAYRAGLRREADKIRQAFGALPAAGLRDRHIASDVAKADAVALRLKAWRFICKDLRPDPSLTVRADVPKSDGHPAWTADDLAAFRARWPIGSTPRACFEVLQWTGARISDAVKIGRGNIGPDGVLDYVQTKTKGRAFCPWTCPLPDYARGMAADRQMMHEAIAGLSGHMTFLPTTTGKGRSDKALGEMIRDAAAKAGVAKTAHGLRKYRATALAEAGATTHEISAWTGHASLKEVEHYTKTADRRRAVTGRKKIADSA
jgi:integrase/recombinase XerD